MYVRKEHLFRALAFGAPLLLYAFTAAPSLYWEDSAGFQLAAVTLGIPHNPSFPLYVLLAKIISLVPLGTPAFMVNFASALFGALACLIVYLLARDLGRLIEKETDWAPVLALPAALLFATVEAVWLQAVRAEVYTLNAFITLLGLWLVLKYVQGHLSAGRFAAIIGMVVGLGLAVHPLLLGAVLFPVLAVTCWWRREELLKARPLLVGMGFAVLGLSIYIYLPIRAAQMPSLSWGDFSTVGGTIRSLLRLDETLPVATLTTTTPFVVRLQSNLIHFVQSVGGLVASLGLIGVLCLWRQQRWLAALFFLPWLMSVLTTSYAAEYSAYNLDLGGYLLPAFAAAMILVPLGPLALGEALKNFMQQRSWLRLTWLAPICALLLVTLIMQTSRSLHDSDKHELTAADDYATELLSTLPQDAIMVAGEDNTFLPLLAKQQLDNLRPDIAVISGGALLRSDYRYKVQQRMPQLWYPSDWNEKQFDQKFTQRLQEWLDKNDATHPVYLTISEWTAQLMPRLQPHLLAYSLESKPGYSPQAEALTQHHWFSHLPEWQATTDLTTREHFARLLYNHGVYLYTHGQGRYAVEYAASAARIDHDNVGLIENCIKLLAANGRWSESIELTKTLMTLEPGNEFAQNWLPRFEQSLAQGASHG